jgi:hypothetical protein
MKIAILNTSILTSYGCYDYRKISVEDAKKLVATGFESYVGHQSTCDVLKQLLDIEVPMNRQQYSQKVGESALVFKLKGRPEEGKILSAEEIEAIGYEFGILEHMEITYSEIPE